MYLYCAHVLPWSVCARYSQHQAPEASYTEASHKGCNPYTLYLTPRASYLAPCTFVPLYLCAFAPPCLCSSASLHLTNLQLITYKLLHYKIPHLLVAMVDIQLEILFTCFLLILSLCKMGVYSQSYGHLKLKGFSYTMM